MTEDRADKTFSRKVKEESAKNIPQARHCRLAELAVILFSYGTLTEKDGERRLVISCEQEMIARKCFTLIEKTFNISVGLQKIDRVYHMEIPDAKLSEEILSAVKMIDPSSKEWLDNGVEPERCETCGKPILAKNGKSVQQIIEASMKYLNKTCCYDCYAKEYREMKQNETS